MSTAIAKAYYQSLDIVLSCRTKNLKEPGRELRTYSVDIVEVILAFYGSNVTMGIHGLVINMTTETTTAMEGITR
jgi:hypothetical protein